jgi:HAMP domain-containing protein
MKLLLKFNLVFLIVFALGLAVSGTVAHKLLQEGARQESLERAGLLMDSAQAVMGYTAEQVAPLLETQMTYTFLPQSIPAFSATEVLNTLRKNHSEYAFKAAMLNPTNPRDRAQDWEEDVIQQFKLSSNLNEFIGQRLTPSGPVTYLARPIKISNPACLRCHSTVEAAPKPMVEKYGPANGFGWNMNEVLGVQVVSVPESVPLQRADRAFRVVMGLLTGVFVLIGLALNLMLWKLVIQPVSRLSKLSDRVSLGELDAPEFTVDSKDEIGTLAHSFSRMRKSLVQAMKMLDN